MSNKIIKVFIEVTVNHIDSVPALLTELSSVMSNENDKGFLEKQDGDKIKWETK